jgi:Mrp family chromosome partitioning ATPase
MLILGASIPGGLLLGLLAALLAERFATSLPANPAHLSAFRPAQAISTYRGPPVLANIEGLSDPRCVDAIIDWPTSRFAQSIGALLHRLRRTSRSNAAMVLAITGFDPAAKASLAVALARAASRSRLRVALVDCDIRSPLVATLLRLAPARVGLVEVLAGATPMARAFRGDPRSPVRLISPTNAPCDRARVLASKRLAEFVGSLRNTCDLVIMVGPSLSATDEIRSLGRLSNAVIVVDRDALDGRAVATAVEAIRARTPIAFGLVRAV